eukprot:jgi/Hompol1/4509/HPOL_003663-RA
MQLFAFLLLLAQTAFALHFYLESGEKKCFHEDLPAGTSIAGNGHVSLASHHTIVDQKGLYKGKFSFTAADSGDHQICLSIQAPGWFNTRTKLYLDIQFADPKTPEKSEAKKSTYSEISDRLRVLTSRIQHIRGELKTQRDREAEFRDMSEVVNSSAIRWTVAQMIVLGITCAWQLRHLGQFFLTKKLV